MVCSWEWWKIAGNGARAVSVCSQDGPEAGICHGGLRKCHIENALTHINQFWPYRPVLAFHPNCVFFLTTGLFRLRKPGKSRQTTLGETVPRVLVGAGL